MTPNGLSEAEYERTARQLALPELGATGQLKLRQAHVCVVGVGGLGSPVISYLAAAGVGTLTVIDDDVVEASNLHRQVIHGVDALGQPKTESAVKLAAQVAPECRVTQVRQKLDSSNADSLLAGVDVIVDGSDSFDTRFTVDAAAASLGIPVVWGAVLGWNAQVTVFAPPLGQTPSAEAQSPEPARRFALTDLYPDNEQTRSTPNCRTAGVIGALCGQAGSLMALETIKLITGLGKPLIGRVVVIDGLNAETRTVTLGNAAETATAPTTTGLQALAEIPAESVVIDVRFASERSAREGIVGSIHLPLERILELTPANAAQASELSTVSAASPIVTVCAEGPRSIRAARHLASVGFPVAGFLDGGLA